MSLRRYELSTPLELHVEAIMPWWHFHRRLALPTHLEHGLEVQCRGSFFVDSSRRVQCLLPLGHFSVVSPHFHSCCTAGLLLTRHLAALLGLVVPCPSWALMRLLRAPLHTRSQSRSASFGLLLTLFFSHHTVFTELVVFWVR